MASGSLKVLGCALAFSAVHHDVEGELLTLDESLHASALDGRNVNKHIRLAAALLDEAEALGGIEELHSS